MASDTAVALRREVLEEIAMSVASILVEDGSFEYSPADPPSKADWNPVPRAISMASGQQFSLNAPWAVESVVMSGNCLSESEG